MDSDMFNTSADPGAAGEEEGGTCTVQQEAASVAALGNELE